MVLVDTSVWIRFLADQAPYAAGLNQLLKQEAVAGHELVYGEHLLASALSGKMMLWTADGRLAGIADDLGIAYQIETRLAKTS
ncbi:MAG TPA: hypothetical protein VNH18_09315 [Bryobacteraceae bacterium]|nr:hypothetical protein [Bryobacteraceae bacterium]